MAEEVVPATTVVKVVLLMLEVVLVDLDTAIQNFAQNQIFSKVHKVVPLVKVLRTHQP